MSSQSCLSIPGDTTLAQCQFVQLFREVLSVVKRRLRVKAAKVGSGRNEEKGEGCSKVRDVERAESSADYADNDFELSNALVYRFNSY